MGRNRQEQVGDSGANGGSVNWQCEFFRLAASVLATKEAALDFKEHGGLLPDGGRYDKYAIFVGELTYAAEMYLVMREAGMLPAQRLGRCAGELLQRGTVIRNRVRV